MNGFIHMLIQDVSCFFITGNDHSLPFFCRGFLVEIGRQPLVQSRLILRYMILQVFLF